MTENTYGLTVIETDDDYDWAEWQWQDYTTQDLVTDISLSAARAVLAVIFEESRMSLHCSPKGCFVRVKLGEDLGRLSLCFDDLIDNWISVHDSDGELREPIKHLEAALETALAKLRRSHG